MDAGNTRSKPEQFDDHQYAQYEKMEWIDAAEAPDQEVEEAVSVLDTVDVSVGDHKSTQYKEEVYEQIGIAYHRKPGDPTHYIQM